ncbi:hypothetical protein BASA81_011299 [Batrachochytrium salamandrivorans]|nr:hypothetical protein BASA81_011299 [Batrachochytrium salamandrivorans]
MARPRSNLPRWVVWVLLALVVANHYRHFWGMFTGPTGEPGTDCNRFRTSEQVLQDNVCFPMFAEHSSPDIVHANLARDIEAFETSNWRSPTDCIYAHKFWVNIRNSPAVIKTFESTKVWRNLFNVFYQGPQVFSVSHRCLNTWGETPWYLSWISPTISTTTFKSAYLDASQSWGGEFFHAIHEKAFSLGAARELLNQNPDMIIIVEVLPPKLAEFAWEILGIPKARFHVLSLTIVVEQLYVPFGLDCASQSRLHTLLTRDWIWDRHPTLYRTAKKPTDITIVHRNEAGICNRCLENSNELYAAFQKQYPLRTVHHIVLGDLPYSQTIKLLAQTEILIAPHGAGLVNMILLPNGAKVIEIQNKDDQCNLCFYELSLALGLRFKAISPLKVGPSAVDFTRVDIEHVLETVKDMMSAH